LAFVPFDAGHNKTVGKSKQMHFFFHLLLLCTTGIPIANAFVMQSRNANTRCPTIVVESSATSSMDGRVADFLNAKAVIFDIDGTLADSWKLGYDATNVVLEKHDIPSITVEAYHEGCIYSTPERLARHVGLIPNDPDFESMGNKLGQEFDEFYVVLVSEKTARFYPGITEILSNLPEDTKLGALTNACVAYAHAVLKVNSKGGDYSRFGSVHGANSVPNPKPSPDGLLEVCKDLGLSPDQCVYVGDSPSDGGAADAAGMPSIGVLWGSNSEEKLRKAPFSFICKNVEELASLLPTTAKV
jgi:HAD superfamily hydrolase (TIGR01549 family)